MTAQFRPFLPFSDRFRPFLPNRQARINPRTANRAQNGENAEGEGGIDEKSQQTQFMQKVLLVASTATKPATQNDSEDK